MAIQSTGRSGAPHLTEPPEPIATHPLPAQDRATARALSVAALVGLAGAGVLVGILHLLPETAGISAVRQTISEYALTDVGWMFNVAVIATAAASGMVFLALLLTRQASWRSIGLFFGGLWIAGLLVIVAFPKHNWAIGPSMNGQIHRLASVVAFLSLPVAVMLLTRRARTASPSGRQVNPTWARVAFWLGAGSLVWFSPLIVAMVMAPRTGTPWFRAIPLGLIERGMVITEVAAIVAVALWALAATRRPDPVAGGHGPTGPTATSADRRPVRLAPPRPTG